MSNDKSQYNGQGGNGYQPLPCAPTPPPGPEVGTPTLADVQPGGRVRLGDKAERARFEAFLSGNPLIALSAGMAWQVWQAALSAQSSPSGQDALASLPLYRLADDANGNRGLHRDDTGSWVKLQDVERALAARQPMEFERAIPTRRRESAVELLLSLGFVWNNQRWEDRRQPVGQGDAPPCWWIDHGTYGQITQRQDEADAAVNAGKRVVSYAARQPVGEPLGYFDPDVLPHLTEGLIDPVGVLRRKPNGTSNVPVWLGPPAQAVDLDELRRAACLVNVVGQIDGHDVVLRNSVLDVIDTRRQRLIDSHSGVSRD